MFHPPHVGPSCATVVTGTAHLTLPKELHPSILRGLNPRRFPPLSPLVANAVLVGFIELRRSSTYSFYFQ